MVFIVALAGIALSACCSVSEAALYAVPLPYTKHLAQEGSKRGRLLHELKLDLARPIAAILIINTFANTAGAAITGAMAAIYFGEGGLLFFSIAYTVGVLFCGEIIPKIIGVAYCRPISLWIVMPLHIVMKIFAPVLWVSQSVSDYLSPDDDRPTVSEKEVLSMAEIGQEEGTLDHFEGSVIANVIDLDKIFVRDILTPRVVVFRVDGALTVGEAQKEILQWNHTRVPLFTENNPEHLTSYVTQRDVYREIVRGNLSQTLNAISRPLAVVPELMRVDKLILQMFERKEHIVAVVDEHGGLAGIVTLEDVVEEIVGHEIIDEYDTIADLRSVARLVRGGGTKNVK
jgi:CBS domain containing-hemolysin-like protein